MKMRIHFFGFVLSIVMMHNITNGAVGSFLQSVQQSDAKKPTAAKTAATPFGAAKNVEASAPSTTAKADVAPVAATAVPVAASAPTTTAKAAEQPATSAKSSPSTEKSEADSSKAKLEVVDVHSASLDTININSGGNWLEKRIWFNKAEQLFDEIRNAVKQTADIRAEFIHEVNITGQKIDEFYETVSFERGQIDQLLKNIDEDISDALQKRGGDLSSQERDLRSSVQSEQKQIEQLGIDIKKVGDFDDQIDKTMMQAFKVIDDCQDLETKAWNNYKEIGAELDDKVAENLYYQIDNIYQNIEQKVKYLNATLLPYLKTKLISQLEQVITNIKTSITTLDQKGIHLEQLIESYEKSDMQTIKQREEYQEQEAEEAWERKQEKRAEEQKEKREAAEKQTAYYKVTHAIQDFACSIVCAYKSVVEKIWEKTTFLHGFFAKVSCCISLAYDKVISWFCMIICYVQRLFIGS